MSLSFLFYFAIVKDNLVHPSQLTCRVLKTFTMRSCALPSFKSFALQATIHHDPQFSIPLQTSRSAIYFSSARPPPNTQQTATQTTLSQPSRISNLHFKTQALYDHKSKTLKKTGVAKKTYAVSNLSCHGSRDPSTAKFDE